MDGKRIKQALVDAGVNQAELAAALGMTPQNLNKILSGDNIKTGTLERVAQFLGRPISFFYNEGNAVSVTGDGNTTAGNNLNDSILIDEIAAQRRLTEQVLAQNGQLLNIIENLTKK